MYGEHDVFECLDPNPPKPTEDREPFVAGPPITDTSEDFDVFECLGLEPLPDKPRAPAPEAKPRRRPATTQFQREFEAKWEPAERYAKRLEWLYHSQKNLLFDAPYPIPDRAPLYEENDPWERDLHSTPHR